MAQGLQLRSRAPLLAISPQLGVQVGYRLPCTPTTSDSDDRLGNQSFVCSRRVASRLPSIRPEAEVVAKLPVAGNQKFISLVLGQSQWAGVWTCHPCLAAEPRRRCVSTWQSVTADGLLQKVPPPLPFKFLRDVKRGQSFGMTTGQVSGISRDNATLHKCFG